MSVQAEVWVPIGVAVIGLAAVVIGNQLQGRNARLAVAEQASKETLDDIVDQRLLLRDEQIVALKSQVTDLVAEVKRLTRIIEQLGGEA